MGSVSTARTGPAPSSAAATARMPEPQPTSKVAALVDDAVVGPALEPRQAQPRGRVEAGAEGHPRVQRDDDVVACRLIVTPGGLDDDAPPQTHDREVLLPGAGPVLLVDLGHVQLADGTQVEGGEVAQALPGHGDGGLGGGHVEGRQVGPDGDRGIEDRRSRQAFLLGREGLLHGDATGSRPREDLAHRLDGLLVALDGQLQPGPGCGCPVVRPHRCRLLLVLAQLMASLMRSPSERLPRPVRGPSATVVSPSALSSPDSAASSSSSSRWRSLRLRGTSTSMST